jgi:2-hydroxychromene-2-carboxylate isomerase
VPFPIAKTWNRAAGEGAVVGARSPTWRMVGAVARAGSVDFYFDVGSPYAWLAAERVASLFEAAVRGGRCCSAPTVIVGGRLFWGDDQLEAAAQCDSAA